MYRGRQLCVHYKSWKPKHKISRHHMIMGRTQRSSIVFDLWRLGILCAFILCMVHECRSQDHPQSSDIQGMVAKFRALAPSHKSIFGVDGEECKGVGCYVVVGMEEGDTCALVMKVFGMSADYFYSINPNVDCRNLFVSQWICIWGYNT